MKALYFDNINLGTIALQISARKYNII